MLVRHAHSTITIAASLIGPLCGIQLIIGLGIMLQGAWWFGIPLCAVAVLFVGSPPIRRAVTHILAMAVHDVRGDRKQAPPKPISANFL